MTPLTKLHAAIAAAERDPHGGKVVLDLDTARALTDAHTQRELEPVAQPVAQEPVAGERRGDRIIDTGFPDGWFIQDRLDDNVALLGRRSDFHYGGWVCICLRPKALTTDHWIPQAQIIAKGFDAVAHPAAPAPVEVGLVERLLSIADGQDAHANNNIGHLSTGPILREAAAALRAQSAPVAGPSQAALDVLAERQRQISAEGWTPEHDDQHRRGALAGAAVCYALNGFAGPIGPGSDDFTAFWPWADEWWKPIDRRRDLVKAGALVIAEIERIDRAAPVAGEGGEA